MRVVRTPRLTLAVTPLLLLPLTGASAALAQSSPATAGTSARWAVAIEQARTRITSYNVCYTKLLRAPY